MGKGCDWYTFRQGDYYCEKKKDYVNSDTYYRYCRGYYYDECPTYKYEESSGCFLTTIVCGTLGFSDDNPVLNMLREFRDNILQKDPKYFNLLLKYDVIGPLISNNIFNDKEKLKLAMDLYSKCLVPICNYISIKNYDKAVSLYENMTLSLVDYYGLKELYNSIVLDGNFIAKQAGHGRSLKSAKVTF